MLNPNTQTRSRIARVVGRLAVLCSIGAFCVVGAWAGEQERDSVQPITEQAPATGITAASDDPDATSIEHPVFDPSLEPLPVPAVEDAAATKRVSRFRLGAGERKKWTRQERTLAWSFAGLNALDAYQTIRLPAGTVEANPLLSGLAGERPDAGATLLYKSATTYGALMLTDRLKSRRARRWALILANSFQVWIVIHNERETGGIVF